VSDQEWTRINELISRLELLPNNQLLKEMEKLSGKGESSQVLKYLRLNFALPTNPWNVSPGQCLAGKYTLIEKVASGGMGVVYRAKQDLIDRFVAIKMIHPVLASDQMFERLKEEISTLGRLDHPGIVRIYDADVHRVDSKSQREAVFYTMELVEGPTLRVWMKEKSPSMVEKLDFFAQVCDAVDHAHDAGVVHRDLKPENILVRKDGSPAILDFGLSTVNATARKNASGQNDKVPVPPDCSGTPAYMSPEKWAQTSDDARGDLYALGVILHELIWGERPLEFDSCDSFEEMREVARDWSFGGVPQDNPLHVDDKIKRIVGALLAEKPENRPKSSGKVGDDIRDYLGAIERRKKLKRRLPLILGFCVLTAVFLIGWLNSLAKQRLMDQSQQASTEARNLLREGAPDVSSKVLSLIPKHAQSRHSESAWKEIAVEAMTSWGIEHSVIPVKGFRQILSMADDGQGYFGINEEGEFALYADGEMHSFDPAEFEPKGIVIHPYDPIVVVVNELSELYVLSSRKGMETVLSEELVHPDTMEFSPDGRLFACATRPSDQEMFAEDGPHSKVLLYNTSIWKKVPIEFGVLVEDGSAQIQPGFSRSITGLAFNHDSSRIASWSSINSGKVNVWDVTTGQLKETAFVGGTVNKAIWDSLSDQLLCVRSDGRCAVWDFRHWQGFIKKLPLKNAGQIQSLTESQNDSIGWLPGNTGFVWQEKGMARVHMKQPEGIQSLDFEGLTDGETIQWNAAKGAWFLVKGGVIHWWTLDGNSHRSLNFAAQEAHSMAFVGNAALLAVSDTSGARLIDPRTLETHGEFDIPLSGPILSSFQGSDLWLYTKWEGPVRWVVSPYGNGNCLTFKKRFSLDRGSSGLMAVSDFSNTVATSIGRQIIINAPGNKIFTSSVATPTIPQSLNIHPDGEWITAGSSLDKWMSLWSKDADGWASVDVSMAMGVPFFSRWMKQDLFVLTRDHLIACSLNNPRQIRTLIDSAKNVTAVTECTHRPLLALASAGRISILDMKNQFESELELPVTMRDGDVIRSVQFNPDGTLLAAVVDGSSIDTLHIWELGELVNTLKDYSLGFSDWNEIRGLPHDEGECVDIEIGTWSRFR
jgi:serine/threonine protein kinase/WD40 repeat protein